MTNPLFWLILSLLFVTISLTVVLVVAIPTLKEVARAARSAEKLFETLRREFPPTLEAIRLTGMEISDLTDELSEGVQNAGQIVKQVDQSLGSARRQARKVQHSTRSLVAGVKTAWKTFLRSQPQRRSDRLVPSKSEFLDELPASTSVPLEDTLNREAAPQPDTSYTVPTTPPRLALPTGTRFIAKAGQVMEQAPLAPGNRDEFPTSAPDKGTNPLEQASDSLFEDDFYQES